MSLVRSRRAHLSPSSSFQNPARAGVDPLLLPHPSFGLSVFFLSYGTGAHREKHRCTEKNVWPVLFVVFARGSRSGGGERRGRAIGAGGRRLKEEIRTKCSHKKRIENALCDVSCTLYDALYTMHHCLSGSGSRAPHIHSPRPLTGVSSRGAIRRRRVDPIINLFRAGFASLG